MFPASILRPQALARPMKRPVIAVTIGDPAGIGPEILLKSWPALQGCPAGTPLAVGDEAVLRSAAGKLGLETPLAVVSGIADMREGALNVFSPGVIAEPRHPVGRYDERCGKASFRYVEAAADLWRKREVSALVTLPIAKKSWDLAGIPYAGHTELLRDLTGAKEYAMIMAAEPVRALLVTTHLSLRQAGAQLPVRRILAKARIGREFLSLLGIAPGRLALAALNPHAGEEGMLGSEERELLAPAVAAMRREGMDAVGPVAADTVFRRAAAGAYDLVLCLHHDQAMIPLKTLWFDALVNITAGIGMVRTSPGHGTGFDIAGTGRARTGSFLAAWDWAVRLVRGEAHGTGRGGPAPAAPDPEP